MSRVSDTRMRTREAAAHLVASGRRPHELTVDAIYAQIKQGSRTTINDELKLWKDEQTKADALSAVLPDPVAKAMLSIWATAVEHGERVFDERRAEVESELAHMLARMEEANLARQEALVQMASTQSALERLHTTLELARQEMQHERAAKEAALQRITDIQEQAAIEKVQVQSQLQEQRQRHEQQMDAQRLQLAASEAKLSHELGLATERLEGVQKHVMLQVSEARAHQRQAEDQLAKALARHEQSLQQIQTLRTEVVSLEAQWRQSQQEQSLAAKTVLQLQAERDGLRLQLELVTHQAQTQAVLLQPSTVQRRKSWSLSGASSLVAPAKRRLK